MSHLTRQLMGINGETFLVFGTRIVQKLNEWKTKTGKTPCAWCKRLWRAFDAVPAGNSRASSGFSACHIIPLSGCIHRKAINRKKLFPAGTASYLWIHQVQSRSDWAVVRRSRWRIHRTTIERESRVIFGTLMFMNWFIKKPLICFWTLNARNVQKLMRQLTRQLMGINGENFLEHELFRNWTNEWKTKTGNKPFSGRNRILSVNSSSAKPQRLSRSKAE